MRRGLGDRSLTRDSAAGLNRARFVRVGIRVGPLIYVPHVEVADWSGAQYALWEKRDAPVQRVRVFEHVRGGKWKAEWIEPNPGLVHFVESAHLVCAWKDGGRAARDASAS